MSVSESRSMKIDIWSDVMCPWCLIGWGNLQQGLKMVEGQISADICWHAFELNPDMPEGGEERTAHIARKYGMRHDESTAIRARMQEAARHAGVSLEYEGKEPAPPAMMWNTFAAHKLLAWAGEKHGSVRQTELNLALFRANFNERRKIGKHSTLVNVAVETGFDRKAAQDALDSADYAEMVRIDEQMARELNITGVPAMLVDDKFIIPGAQPPATYADVLTRLAEKQAASSA